MTRPADRQITPFWNRIPQFFLYPFRPTALVLMLVFGVLASALIGTSFLGLLGAVFIIAVSLKYAYYILDHTAQGHRMPPKLSSEFLLGDYSILFKQVLIFFLIGVVTAVVATVLGATAALIFQLLAQLALPASIMMLATTHSFTRAANPSVLFDLITRLGWPYLILCAFLFFLNIGSTVAYGVLGDSVPLRLQVAMFTLITMYFTFVMYNMMGYVIYQYHDDLGFSVAEDEEDNPDSTARPGRTSTVADEGMALVERFVQEENFAAAAEELKSVIRRHPDNLELRMRFHRLIRLTDDVRQLTYHGGGLIERLLDVNRVSDAAQVYLDCVAADNDFRPEKPEQFLPIARHLRTQGKHVQVVQLVNGFHKRFPGDFNTPELYLLVAEIFIDDLRQDQKAKPVLQFLARQFPDHALAGKVHAYQAALA